MKKIVFFGFFCFIYMLSIINARSQNGDQGREGVFLKRIEHNRFAWGENNLNSKKSSEKRLLEDFNAPIEFFFDPSFEKPVNPAAFRIVREASTNVYILNYTTFKNTEPSSVNDEILNRSFTVSDQFAEKMYKKMVSFIEIIKARGPLYLFVDGYEVTFRAVVEDEVWSLIIQVPMGNALKMSDLCRQILVDAHDNKLDEASYIKILDSFDFERQRPNN